MQVRNNETGKIETMRFGPAQDAVSAGTHTIVNVDESGKPKRVLTLGEMSKDQLLATATKRGVEVSPSATKAEILAALQPEG
jgi:hypothetical protein